MRLKTRRQYLRMKYDCLKFYGKFLYIQIRSSHSKPAKLGITVTRRFGCACKRNRFKRMVREAFRLSFHSFNAPIHILVSPVTKQEKEGSLEELKKELCHFTSQAIKSLYPITQTDNLLLT